MKRGAGDIFQTYILQRVRLGTGVKNICAQINTQLDFWISGTFNELINDSYVAAKESLDISCGNQKTKQCHCTFSNLVLSVKLREAINYLLHAGNRGIFVT